MTHRPDWHDYEVEPDRIVRRNAPADNMMTIAAAVFMAFVVTLGAICLAVLVGLALFIWGW